jgi:hypothetical protein
MKTNTFLYLLILLSLFACRNNGEKNLAEVEKQELAKGIRNDSLFMGVYLGMTEKDFLDHCWKMNKQNVFTEGSKKTVECQLDKQGFNYPIQINFYPGFKNEKIYIMPVIFSYKSLDIFNPNMQTDNLLKEVKHLLEKWYGQGFFLTTLPDAKKAFAKVDGNRSIIVLVEKDFEVTVMFTDLTAI